MYEWQVRCGTLRKVMASAPQLETMSVSFVSRTTVYT